MTLPAPPPAPPPAVVPLGDSAFLLRFGSGAERSARAAAAAVRRAAPLGLRDVTVSYDALAVYFDPLVADRDALAEAALRAAESSSESASARDSDAELHTIPVRYDGEDLERVAASCGLTPAAVAELHASAEYRVAAVGFVPGFAYLDGLDERLHLPRRATPRPRVPAGSVAIAGAQTAVYPFATPGGWHLIGRTDVVMFDPRRESPSLLAVGSRVRFVPR
jgi:KipI family sensor histidine kinase inhibitor